MVKLAVEIVELLKLVVDRHGVVAKAKLGAHAVGGPRQTPHAGHVGNGVVFLDDLIQQRVGRLVVLVLETRFEIRQWQAGLGKMASLTPSLVTDRWLRNIRLL